MLSAGTTVRSEAACAPASAAHVPWGLTGALPAAMAAGGGAALASVSVAYVHWCASVLFASKAARASAAAEHGPPEGGTLSESPGASSKAARASAAAEQAPRGSGMLFAGEVTGTPLCRSRREPCTCPKRIIDGAPSKRSVTESVPHASAAAPAATRSSIQHNRPAAHSSSGYMPLAGPPPAVICPPCDEHSNAGPSLGLPPTPSAAAAGDDALPFAAPPAGQLATDTLVAGAPAAVLSTHNR
eukprot:scaffold126822_cov18-Tisochrysis_lutea.AAC.1